MIIYDPGKYGITYAISLRGSVFPRAAVPGLLACIISTGLHYAVRLNSATLQQFGAGDASANVLGGFSFILGFLIVFRSQQAYSRWWEGGTLLQQLRGEWFNSFSCLIAFCNADKDKKVVKQFQHQLVRLFSLLYGCALQQVATMDEKKFELIACEGLETKSLKYLQGSYDRCEITLQWIQRLIVESEQKQITKIAPPILSRVFNELGNGIVNLNNARKITDFPIPFHLAQMITIMLIGHSVFTVFICAVSVETPAWSAIIAFLVVFSYWSVYYISLEMEMPFGDDCNDLPLQEMQGDMNKSLIALLDPEAQEVPAFDYNPEEHDQLRTNLIDFDRTLVPPDPLEDPLEETSHAKIKSPGRYSVVKGGTVSPTGSSPGASFLSDSRAAILARVQGPTTECPELQLPGNMRPGSMDDGEPPPYPGRPPLGSPRSLCSDREQDEPPRDLEAAESLDTLEHVLNTPLPPSLGEGPDVAAGGAVAHPLGGAQCKETHGRHPLRPGSLPAVGSGRAPTLVSS